LSEEDKKRGLYKKYDVSRTDGQDKGEGKHRGCRLFILDYTDDPFARPALAEYALAAQAEYPVLANELLDTLRGMGYEHKYRGRKVIGFEIAKVIIVDLWPILWPINNHERARFLCGHSLSNEMKKLQKELVLAIQDHDPIFRDTVLTGMAAVGIQFFYRHKSSADALADVQDRMVKLMERQGPRAFISSHEILGVLVEEVSELSHAVKEHDCASEPVQIECMDIALGAIFSLCCSRLGGLEW